MRVELYRGRLSGAIYNNVICLPVEKEQDTHYRLEETGDDYGAPAWHCTDGQRQLADIFLAAAATTC